MDNSPIVIHSTKNWMVAAVVGKDDYRLGAYIERLDKRSMWRISDGEDLSATFDELRELHDLLGRVLAGEPGEPFPHRAKEGASGASL